MITLAQRLEVKQEILNKLFDEYDFDLRVCSPGKIVSFDEKTMTAVVQLVIKEAVQLKGKAETIKIQELRDVPVVVINGGGYALTFPIQPDDECLVFFGDTCIDSWWQNGDVQEPMSLRRHDLSDGFALVGPKSLQKLIQPYSRNSAQLRSLDGTKVIEIYEGGVGIKVGGSTIKIEDGRIEILSGNVLISENVTISGRNFLQHFHSGVKPGEGITGPVL